MKNLSILLALLCVAVFAQENGTFEDTRDGKIYKYVKIGTQTWMAENLNYAETAVNIVICHGDKNRSYKNYGKLYTWDAAMKACPRGWHLPSRSEWNVLIEYVGGEVIAGKKLKAKNGWKVLSSANANGTDNFGFAALPGSESAAGCFSDFEISGNWWTATMSDSSDVRKLPRAFGIEKDMYINGEGRSYYKSMNSFDRVGDYFAGRKLQGYSVRCVKD